MPGKGEKEKEEETPGFLYPNIDLTREKKPEWQIGKDKRGDKKKDEGPGPADYELGKEPGAEKPKWTMVGRKPDKKEVKTPGPGQYESKDTKKKNPVWSFPKEERDNAKPDETPGPGDYEYDQNPIRTKKPEYIR